MLCLRCQSENPPQAKFCLECGARLALTCAKCRSGLPAGAKFCPECGEPLAAWTGAESRFPSPESYTPKHLAEKILTSRGAIEGEHKQVTVLFADMKGSMELLADRGPEEALKLLDPVLERMMEAVHRYEGTVNQVMGDGIMALFGAPVAHEDHAVRACYAALRMQETVARYGAEVQRSNGVPVTIRVGLNSGEVVVRSIGSDLNMDYTAVGQTTHLAARMEQMAKPGSILVAAETLRLAEGYVQIKPLGPVSVKGMESPVGAYEIIGMGPVRSRLQVAVGRGLTRFVGRDAELEQLRQALEQARTGHGQIVAVVGEAGVGKSRLFYEFAQSHRIQDTLIVEAGTVSHGKATAYLPVINLLKAYFQIGARDDLREVRDKVIEKLLSLDRALEPSLAALLWLLDGPVEDVAWERLDPSQRRQRTLDGVKRLLLRETQVQLLLLVFEDLHWIDTETQALLDSFVESVPTAKLLLLVSYRPEYQHAWSGKTYYRQIRLDPLPPENSEELLDALLGSEAGLRPLRRLLIGRTEGNPFFLEESVRTLVETEVLVGERGEYHLAKAFEPIQMPPTLQAVLAARIDRLPPEAKRLLQSAAVVGKDVPFALLQAIAGLPDKDLRSILTRLQAAEFIYETRLFPDLEYTFKHALTHEVAYESLLHDRRRALHASIADATEQLYPDRQDEHIERLAHHAFYGELWGKAASYLRQAGGKATERSAYRESVAFFERALVALGHLPESCETFAAAIDLRFDLRTSFFNLGELDRSFERLREAAGLAETIGDQGRLGWALAFMAAHFSLYIGDHVQAFSAAQRALVVAEGAGDGDLRTLTTFFLGRTYYAVGDYHHASDLLKRSIDLVQSDPGHRLRGLQYIPAVTFRAWFIWALAERGDFSEAIAHGEEAIRIASEADRPYDRIISYFGLGGVYLRKGDVYKAIDLLEQGLSLCQKQNIPLLFVPTAARLGYAYAFSGRAEEALLLLNQAVRQAESMGFQIRNPTGATLTSIVIAWVTWLSDAYLLAGRTHDAMQLAGSALAACLTYKERGHQAWFLRLLAEIALHSDVPDTRNAEAFYRQALGLAEELGMRPLSGHCRLGLAKLHLRVKQLEQGRVELSSAVDKFRSLGMTTWATRAQLELAGEWI